MRNLFELILKNRNLLTFVLLELICFLLLIRFNINQRQIFFSSANRYTGQVYELYAQGLNYFSLTAENTRLEKENEILRQKLQDFYGEEDFQVDTFYTAEKDDPAYRFISAKVIKNSITALDNVITINKGTKDGVEKDMGVADLNGIVGTVVDASENYAVVMSLFHRQTRVSAKISSNGHFGSLVWKENNPLQVMDIDDIPKHAVVNEGDTIITSGYSYKFPPGLLIGTIQAETIKSGSNFYSIKVRLVNDLSKLSNVYVIDYINKRKIQPLEAANNNE
ncbi:MAG: rod shape-determining protein MreC [Bacteroidota bacterium]